jgi:hypothetical protein
VLSLEPRTRIAIALFAAFPLLIAFQILLIVLGAPGRLLAIIGVFVWLGGPALAIAGVVMLWRRGRWQAAPCTPEGRLALWLLGGFAGLFLVFWLMVALEAGPDRSETFLSNLYLAIPLLLAGGCAILGGFSAAYALFVRKERSLFVVGVLVIGVFVALFTAGEIGGHDEPDGSKGARTPVPRPTATVRGTSPGTTTTPQPTPLANSHSNLSVEEVAPGEVRVSFDYAYNHDPTGVTITAITVSALDAAGAPLAGYDAVARPISRGSGHMDVTLTFTPEQLAAVRSFSVCFTAPGEPDLGCAVKEYVP